MNTGNVAAMSNNCYNAIKSNDNGYIYQKGGEAL